MAAIQNDLIIRDEINGLPEGLNNNNSHYINTGHFLKLQSTVEIKFKLRTLPSSITPSYIFGAKETVSGVAYNVCLYVNRRNEESTECVFRASVFGASSALIIGTAELDTVYTVVIDISNASVSLNGTTTRFQTTGFILSQSVNAYAFSSNDMLAMSKANITLYSLKIYDNGVIQRDYTPKQEETSVGLYDSVNDALNTGTGSGNFAFVPATSDLFHFTNDTILDISAWNAIHLIGEELSIDTLDSDVYAENYRGYLFRPADMSGGKRVYSGIRGSDGKIFAIDVFATESPLINIKYGTPIYWYTDGVLKGKYFIKKITREAKTKYKIDAISAIGLLDKMMYSGRLFNATKFVDILAELMNVNPEYMYLGNVPSENYDTIIPCKYLTTSSNIVFPTPTVSGSQYSITIDFTTPSTISSGIIVTNNDTSPNVYTVGINSSKAIYCQFGSLGQYTTATVLQTDHRYTLEIKYSRNTASPALSVLLDGEQIYTTSITPFISLVPYRLGASNFKIHEIKIWNGFDLVGWYKPCKISPSIQNNVGIFNTIDGMTAFRSPLTLSVGEEITPIPVLPYTVDSALNSLLVMGWLPYDTKRNNLQQLLFAYNIGVQKLDDGTMNFTYFSSDDVEEIVSDDIYLDGKVEYPEIPKKITVTEHQYVRDATAEVVELFKTDEQVNSRFVPFNQAPIITSTLSANGLVVEEAHSDWAIVSGIGYLRGIPVTHNKILMSVENNDADTDKEITVDKCTMVTSTNSANIRDKVLAYYRDAKTIKNSFVRTNQTLGMPYTFLDPFGDRIVAMLSEMEMHLSSNVKADATLIAGYVPNGGQGIYTRSKMLTGSGTFDFAALEQEVGHALASVKMYLIGGGQGGQSGASGENGQQGQKYATDTGWSEQRHGGVGGEKGAGGQSGKVLVVELTNPSGTFTYACASVGPGGTADRFSSHDPTHHNNGSYASGTSANTRITAGDIGTYTSADGRQQVVADMISGKTYGQNGNPGVDGGDGGSSVPQTAGRGSSNNGDSVQFGTAHYNGGFAKNEESSASAIAGSVYASGGNGGGAAYGNNGGDAQNAGGAAVYKTFDWADDWQIDGYSGKGGDGATPMSYTDNAEIGCGGDGGHGGGGGGQGGNISANWSGAFYVYNATNVGLGGTGGFGSNGQNGGPGGILLLY